MKRILIVDDLISNRRILVKMLCGDYETVEAGGGAEAESILKERHGQIDAVLLDISMPDVDGYEVLRRMRADPRLAYTPVIMITGTEDEKARVKALSLGANDFVMKPYNSEIIKHCLRNNILLRESMSIIHELQRDKLTGMLLRDTFLNRAAEMIAKKEPGYYVMAYFDVDSFKVINDQYGTAKGDEILMHIAAEFKSGFEPHGGICCRITADNFAVLYPQSFMDSEGIAEIRERVTHIAGIVTPVTFSIGRYVVDDLSMQPSAMLDRAVIAAESVKGRYDTKIALYDESMRSHLLHEQAVVMEMEGALRERQFEVWYQPQINHSTGAQIGAEALVRWRHPIKGLIPPNMFIPIFEANGFIYELDKFVWEDVCARLRRWTDEGRNPLPVSVNISRYDVFCEDLADTITGLVEKYRLSADMLRLEITETAFAESAGQIIKVVNRLIERGFTVEIDDFGSGYSSLNTLKDVPAQVIKLDMRFLESSNSDRGGNIVESVVRMAKWLNMSVIAEGVETVQQADYLYSVGCSYIQGYLYARPMPAADYESFCADAVREERLITMETVENLDNNSFWNPASLDTLIFNSYVGAACIYEYCNGSIELIPATEKYAQVIGSAGMTVEAALRLNWAEHLDEETGRRLIADLDRSIATKKEITGEYVFHSLPGCPEETYLRSTMRVIATTGDRYLVYCTNENLTAQRQAEKREREVADEMRLIMANVSCGICASEKNENGDIRVIFANDRYYSMLGYTRELADAELDGDMISRVHSEDKDKTMSLVAKLMADRGSATYEYRCVKRDGSVITVRCVNTVTAFDGVSDTVLLAVLDDVTEQNKAERTIRTMAEQLSAIMQNINGGLTATVVDGDRVRLLFANAKHYEQLGFTKETYEAQYSGIPDRILADDKARVLDVMHSMSRTREPATIEFRIARADGAVRWLRSSMSIIDYPGESLPVHLAVASDVTEQLEAQQQVRKLSEQLQAILDNVDVGIVATVIQNGRLRILMANDFFYAMRGYTREQYQSEVQNPHLLIDEAARQSVFDATVAVTATGESTVLEYELMRRDGSKRMLRNAISIGRFDDIAEPVQLSIFRDITDEKELERRERRAAEQAQVIMRDIDSGITATIMNGGKVEAIFSNERFFSLRGYTREQYRAEVHDFYEPIHPEDRERVREATLSAYSLGRSAQQEYRLRRRDGSERWMKISMSVTRFSGIEQPVALTIYTDITDRRLEQQRLGETTEQLQSMMDDMPGGFVRMIVEDDGAIKPLFFNTGFYALTGMSHDELMAIYADDAMAGVHPDDLHIVHEAVQMMFERGKAHSSRYRLLHKSGEYIWLRIFGRITRSADGRTYLNIYYTDAAEQEDGRGEHGNEPNYETERLA